MSVSSSYVGTWKLCALVSIAMALLSLIPQIHLWASRGRDWNGAYATLQGDEFLYSAYINALIDGRPRRNDPFAGKDSTLSSPLPESTFSIQFIPAYAISLPARVFGVSASTAFIVLEVTTALLASLSLFWLLVSVTGDRRLAAAGVLLVLVCGELTGDQGLIGVLLLNHKRTLFLPFLRRYQPAAVFPLIFVFCALIWRSLTGKDRRLGLLHSTLAGLTLGVLVFSYLYLWTAAAAWLFCLAGLWLYLRPAAERRRSIESLSITAAITLVALIPYAVLVSHRAASLDNVQILVLSHRPDLFHTSELIGTALLFIIIVATRGGKLEGKDPRLIFASAFAFTPFLLFNQQLLTGRSMQPLHFDYFVANYMVLISLLIVAALLWRPIPKPALLWIGALCVLWGAAEITLLSKSRISADISDDQTIPVLLRLKELSQQDGTVARLSERGQAAAVVFSPQVGVMRLLPAWTSQATLLGAGSLDFGSASQKERRELLYLHLYFSGVDSEGLRTLLNEKSDDLYMNFYAPSVLFGDERIIPELSLTRKPILEYEIEQEVSVYQAYVDSFSRETVLLHPLTYLVTHSATEGNLEHINQWYERDRGERIGMYTLYRLKLRE